MRPRILCDFESNHYNPWSSIRVDDQQDLLRHLRLSDVKMSVLLCCSNIQARLLDIHDMDQVLEIYVCNEHVQIPDNVLLLSDYPKVKVVPLDDRTSNWKSSAYHNIAMSCDTVNEHFDHQGALDLALRAAHERISHG
jgi:hypothetical protein